MSNLLKITASTLLLLPLALNATPDTTGEPQTATARLMAMQSSGEQASSTEQHLSGKVRSEVYQRYVKSFAQPIPNKFIDESFTDK
ncbi:DUF3613 domain-containing protein [Zhongshania sp.]|uniref:DUF3613 domain-containing protein n=1 Tax=Zhongshania sp. TaxID=1971902 RepID=UPI003561885A